MHGYIDSFPVPMHLPTSSAPAPSKSKGKGKEKHQQQGQGQPKVEVYDIVANWTAQEKDDVERKVAMASRLGYSTVILTVSILATTNPASLVFPTPLLPAIDPRTAPKGTSGLVLQLWKIHVQEYTDEHIKSASVKGYYGFSNSTASLFPASTTLLSVTPTSLTSFSHVALSLSPPSPFAPTLITLDPSLSPRLPFPLKRGLVNTLQRAGVVFEIILRGMTKQDEPGAAGGAASRRRNWIAGAREVVRATGGKGVVISSGAVKAGEMRGTEDLINLCSLIGLTPSQAKDALTLTPQRAILRGLAMRQTYRGVISNPTLITTTPTASSSTTAGAKRTAAELEFEGSNGGAEGGKRRKSAAA
ncbi:RNase P subunit p30-domain-containing protein [Leucosporidium creatinivorum]|uniref:RNase P subunit p30-domain-containing protein n=1 Tax=Leucosporidium creatinivorum TaxID=106004 RepID=A0A1Y2CJI8_9BASI|nr:RNase P subunit p30-domain-containing protein [Leucosporidium creatinivorum]